MRLLPNPVAAKIAARPRRHAHDETTDWNGNMPWSGITGSGIPVDTGSAIFPATKSS